MMQYNSIATESIHNQSHKNNDGALYNEPLSTDLEEKISIKYFLNAKA